MRLPALILLAGLLPVSQLNAAGYHRFPALHGDTVVFTAEGDLWRIPTAGGVARRLTTHPGMEDRAAISPDGTTLAFSAAYEGPTEVYTMPIDGGAPVRRTFDGTEARVVGWTPGGHILYATAGHSTLPNHQLFRIDPAGGRREAVPLAQASDGVFGPDGRTLVFTRLPKQGSSTRRYRGGWIENLWRLDPGAAEAVPLTSDFPGTSRNPMWHDGRIHFVSDRDGVQNLWSMATDGTDLRQHTRHSPFDIQGASLHGGRIVYQLGADLRLHDLASGEDRQIPITLASDFDQTRERWVKDPFEFLTAAHSSPDGDRVVLTARGQVFVAPFRRGRLVEVPREPGVRYRDARFLPDGKSLVALSDASGELEFWKLPADGIGQPVRLTTNGAVFRYPGVPSPDGTRLASADKDQRLWIHDLATGEAVEVDRSPMGDLTDFAWSPDGGWLAYVAPATNTYPRIWLYDVTNRTRVAVTSDRVDSHSPAWSPDGDWLYFLSDRELRSLVTSPWGPRQPEPFFTETTRPYALALRSGLRWPFAPPDELSANPPPASGTGATNAVPASESTNAPPAIAAAVGTNPPPARVRIDLDGLSTRLFQVPVPAGNYRSLTVTRKHLLYVARDTGFDAKDRLMQLEITARDPKPKTLVEDVTAHEVTADGRRVLVRKGKAFHGVAVDASAPAKLEDPLPLDGWTFAVVPREEWRQIYVEAWRMLRDFFYDRNLHGVDWPAVRDRYLPLVDRVTDRAELSDVLSQMAGELSALHIYVRYGDAREGSDKVVPARLGGWFERDPEAGGWWLRRVYQADPDYPEKLSPLARPGVDLQPGDLLTHLNGRATADVPDLGMLLRNQAGMQVLARVRRGDSDRQVVLTPTTPAQEEDLRYTDWEIGRRRRVEELADGRIGYVHLRAMGAGNIAEWAREYYPVFNRQGLVIDVRNNRGGNIDSWILGRLLRQAWFYWQPRTGLPEWNMQYAFRGHLVVLCNERTASDGEAFAEGFRRLGLGRVIGTRTWGGEIWLSARRWLVDSGMATAAEVGVYGPEGEWLIEGHGVDPDEVVDNLPRATFLGSDAQLDAAVRHLLERIEADPRPVPSAPRHPDKSFPR